MPNLIKIEGCPGLVKDTITGAVISNNKNDYEEFKKRKSDKNKIFELEHELAKLKKFCKTLGYNG